MPDQSKTKPNWTIMVYIAADDTLADFAVGSLQQLRRVAIQDPNVVVVAQFDANGKQDIPRLIFDSTGKTSESIHNSKRDVVASNTNMSNPLALSDFIEWACAQRPANHYCLVLWGHGPELLADDYTGSRGREKTKMFLTPADLRKALAKAGVNFEIVLIDACNMSMVELAVEISDYVKFIVASEEEVPDFSFPYEKLLGFGSASNRNQIANACREMPAAYMEAYRDYILTQTTQTASITLSSLSLENVGSMTQLIGRLAEAFKGASQDKEKRRTIIDARAQSKAFVSGLYVDLADFCDQLMSELDLENIDHQNLVSACENIRRAIRSRDGNTFVIANEASKDKRCNGISIYFPYQTDPEQDATDQSVLRKELNLPNPDGPDTVSRGLDDLLNGTIEVGQARVAVQSNAGTDVPNQGQRGIVVKDGTDVQSRGGTDVLRKGGTDVLRKGGTDVLRKMLRQRIEETEQYYASLDFSEKTRWDEFIRHGWSRWLAEEAEAKVKASPQTDLSELLNGQYSAQQCALNLLSLCRKLENDKKASATQAG